MGIHLRRAVPLLILAAGPAWADGALPRGPDIVSWGRRDTAFVQLLPAVDHPATVVFENALTLGNPMSMTFALEIEGLSVEVVMTMGQGDLPDVMLVEPPPGLMAEPASVSVAEGASGRIELVFLPTS